MKTIEIKVNTGIGTDSAIYLYDAPETCNFCGNGLTFMHTGFPRDKHSGKGISQTVYHISYCGNDSCRRNYICEYHLRQEPGNLRHYDFYGQHTTVPLRPRKHKVSEAVTAISPMFTEIYEQAIASENVDLDQLTGIGLRKALEFLIKDYALSLYPDQKNIIVKQKLGVCIDKYVTDVNVRECSKRAVWIGNDEAHYETRWTDRDINDLKALIQLTIIWLENALRTADYLKKMKLN